MTVKLRQILRFPSPIFSFILNVLNKLMASRSVILPPSPWVLRFAPLIKDAGNVLDLACGSGRHTVLFTARGHRVTAVDRDLSRLSSGENIEALEADLEGGNPWPLPGRRFDGIVVANYLFRPLLPTLTDSLSPGGVLIYETFAAGNEVYGRPRNPDFLLRDGELLDAVAGKLTVVAYESGRIESPAAAAVQRITAVNAAENPVPIPPPA
jgi:SAM-dependent methyltransferase